MAIRDFPQRALHPPEIQYLAFDVIEVGTRHPVGVSARSIRMMDEGIQFADLVEREAEFPGAPNKRQSFYRCIVVLPISVARSTRGRQQRNFFVVTDRLDIDV